MIPLSTQVALQSQVVQRAWKDPDFRQKLLSDPKAAIQEALGISLPSHLKLKTVEESSDEWVFVLPASPAAVLDTEVKPQIIWP
ncbi:NHLP leader peptide family RiPP precursor [Gorillibacterium timonense]|uniref:NHLP leader peptide family RiPP precursor n=1 Tax=Gorillibacterium timonense TaxID=1689269 RepID=UPI00292A410C|nr:NHLP leader peptide family RiPP precursor [Gorillibacterium timonense]